MSDAYDEIGAVLDLDDAELQSLADQARADPPPGAPLHLLHGGEEHLIEPGEWMAGGYADRWTRLPPACPVTPLGFEGDTFFFLNTVGQVAILKANSSGKGPIGALFAGRSAYLEWAWPRFGKGSKGAKGPVVGWEADDARQALMDACAYVGSFDDADMVRGRGAWTDAAGRLVYHAGDRVLADGRWHKPGRVGPWVYSARPAIGTPWPQPVAGGPNGPAETLKEIYSQWNWRRKEIDAHLLLGFTCMAMVGGALDWRSMVFVTAEPGSGKSTLQRVMATAQGRGLIKSVNTTGPGLYQKLKHDSLPVLVDELEAQAGNSLSKVLAIVELIRTASSGGKINRGSSEGVAREYECRSPFICTSINIPPMRGQDQSRFAVLNLDKFEKAEADPQFDWRLIEDVGRQLLRRMIDGWPRWPATLVAFKRALIEFGGHEARGAEQFGGLLAAAHLAESDEPPTAAELERWGRAFKASGMAETANKTDDWRECLNHMLEVIPEGLRNKGARRPTVGARLAAFRRSDKALEDLLSLCAQVGLAVSFPKRDAEGRPVRQCWETARLFIPGSHPETRKLFAGTTWEGVPGATGVWATTLQRAPADMIWTGECGKGLDKKRWGLFVDLAKAFPRPADGEDDEGEPLELG